MKKTDPLGNNVVKITTDDRREEGGSGIIIVCWTPLRYHYSPISSSSV